MPEIVADSVDAFVFRKSGSRVQFLLLQRETTRSFAGVWQSMHTRIEQRETTLAAARRSIRSSIGVDPLSAYSIDYVGQIFDHERDLIVLSPTIAFALPPGAEYTLGDGYKALAWFDAEDAASRLLWSDQREAIRRFATLVLEGGDDVELYRIG